MLEKVASKGDCPTRNHDCNKCFDQSQTSLAFVYEHGSTRMRIWGYTNGVQDVDLIHVSIDAAGNFCVVGSGIKSYAENGEQEAPYLIRC